MFAYCKNNPVIFSDDEGLRAELTSVMVHGDISRFSYIHFSGRPWSDLMFDLSWSAYDSRDYYSEDVAHLRLLSAEVSGLSFSKEEATILNATASLMELDIECGTLNLSPYDLGIAELSLGMDNHTIYASAMATIWNPNISLDLGFCTLSLGANIGSVGVEFEIGKDGISWGAAAVIGLSGSISF